MKMTKLKLLLTAAIVASVAPNTALAQDNDLDEIVVTGSRLKVNPNLTAPSPILSISNEAISARGTVNIEDFTNNLPQVFPGQSAAVSNGATGTANLDLRGLGATRTLSLIDGRRLPFGDSSSSAVNLDLVPTGLIERVEIVTGGASAVYGSDAVAGVANFVLKDDFEGIEVDAQFGFEQNGNGIGTFDQVLAAGGQPIPDGSTDGEEFNISVTAGTNFAGGRGNITLFGSYQDRDEISQADRSFSACALGANDDATDPLAANGFECAGSANFRLFGGPGGFGFQQEDGTVDDFFATSPTVSSFNFGPFNFFQRPAERFQAYARGHFDITEDHQVFADVSFVNNTSDAQVAPTASFGIGAFSINCDNPLIQGNDGISLTDIFGCTAADIAAGNDVSGITASHRNVEGGPRNSNLENEAFRIVGGLRGTLADNFDYEVFGQYSRTTDEDVATEDFVVANVQQAFFVEEDANGNIVCRDQSNGCVPYNIFQRGPNGESLVTQESLDFITGVGVVEGETEQIVFGANVQTDLTDFGFASPYADAGPSILIGFEYREDSLESNPDEISQIAGGGFTGVGGASLPVEGEVEVLEFYGEARIPLLSDLPFVHELSIDGQYRYSDYDTDGNGVQNSFNTDTFGGGVSWSLAEELTVRGQFQRAVRAPNVIELFTGQDVGLANLSAGPNGLSDPCAGPNPAASFEACAFTGVTAAQFGNIIDVISGQTQAITGGNPNLDPESSDTFTVGFVFAPDVPSGLTVSVDYFDISIDDFISAGVGEQVTLDECLATGNPTFCNLITRDAAGSLNSGTPGVGFISTNLNIAELETSGFDFQINYGADLADLGLPDWGSVSLNYAGTLLESYDFTPFPGGTTISCAGTFGTDCPQPVNSEYRHTASVNWAAPYDVNITTTWRHFSGTENFSDTAPTVDASLSTVDYIDLSGTYEVREGLELRAGVNNLFLTQPPVSVSAGAPLGNGNTFPSLFDTGRFLFFGLKAKI